MLSFLQDNRERLKLEQHRIPERLSCVLLTPRFKASRHVVCLVLPAGQPEPVLVAKIPRLPGSTESIGQEAANLQAIQASRPGGFSSIPSVIAYETYRGHPILIETALIGQPLDPAAMRRDWRAGCDAVTGWLAEIQQGTCGASQPAPDWFKWLIERPMRCLTESFPLSSEERQLLEHSRQLVSALADTSLPLVLEHGDVAHPNLLWLKNGEIGVLDWELAELRGLPACDLFFFLAYVAFAKDKAHSAESHLRAFQSAFFGDSAWARPYIQAYAEQLGLGWHTLRSLFVACWLRYVAGLLTRLGSTESGGSLTSEIVDWLRSNRYYALWRYSVAHACDLRWGNGS